VSHPATGESAIARLLEEARSGLDRVTVDDLAAAVAAGAMVVDIRPTEQRSVDGELPGAVVIDRNVLEWRLDPTSPHRLEQAEDPHRRIIVVCNEGYSSSLTASTLRRLGLPNATDLVGGFQEWLVMVDARQVEVEGGRNAARQGRSPEMDPVSFESAESFSLDDPGMYGIETVLAKKLGFPVGRDVVRGALVRDRAGGHTYFVTDEDLARYRQETTLTIDSSVP
jgi:rhodanese-related sulfurtransferase